MKIDFYKFDGAGNDFVVVDNRRAKWHPDEEEVRMMCHRRFGVGADGLMLLDGEGEGGDYAFVMHYYNSDGRLGSMCGNGGRCIAAFAHMLGMGERLHFLGYDGPHDAEVVEWDGRRGVVRLGLRSVKADEVRRVLDGWFLDTGSPHYVLPVENLKQYDVVGEGRRWRHRLDLFPEGANIDFVEELPDGRLAVRTYERGVEDETWACGTGVTACALVSGKHSLVSRGGDFRVDFADRGDTYDDVWLTGPVAFNFSGSWPVTDR